MTEEEKIEQIIDDYCEIVNGLKGIDFILCRIEEIIEHNETISDEMKEDKKKLSSINLEISNILLRTHMIRRPYFDREK